MLTLGGREQPIRSLAFAPKASLLAVGDGSQIEIWEITTRAVIARFDVFHRNLADAIMFDRHGKYLLVDDYRDGVMAHKLLGLPALKVSASEPWSSSRFVLSPTRDQCVYVHNHRHYRSIRMPEASEPVPEWEVPAHSHITQLVFMQTGCRFISIEDGAGSSYLSARLTVRSAVTGNIVAETTTPIPGTSAVAVHPTGEWVVIASGRWLFVCDTTNLGAVGWKQVAIDPVREITAVAFHPSGRYLGVTNRHTMVRFYDTATWTVAKTYAWNIGNVRPLAFSADGLLAAAGSSTGKVVVWDVDV